MDIHYQHQLLVSTRAPARTASAWLLGYRYQCVGCASSCVLTVAAREKVDRVREVWAEVRFNPTEASSLVVKHQGHAALQRVPRCHRCRRDVHPENLAQDRFLTWLRQWASATGRAKHWRAGSQWEHIQADVQMQHADNNEVIDAHVSDSRASRETLFSNKLRAFIRGPGCEKLTRVSTSNRIRRSGIDITIAVMAI